MQSFLRCGREEIFATCLGCSKVEKFFYSCNRKWCPRCQPRLASARADKIEIWANKIRQPKHLVLTQRNIEVLTRKSVRKFIRNLAKLRRAVCWREVRGGCASVEITNEGKGWHIHAHILLDVDWLEMPDVRDTWAKLLGQETAIVKVMDCRGKDYLQEVCKYAAKGSEMARWAGDDSLQLIQAIKSVRLFFPFGSLFGMQAEIKRELARQRGDTGVCPCGCAKRIFQTENDLLMDEISAARGDHRKHHGYGGFNV
jgi:hypothetical protein